MRRLIRISCKSHGGRGSRPRRDGRASAWLTAVLVATAAATTPGAAAAAGPAAGGGAAPAERTLLAHAAGDALWVARVVPRPPDLMMGPAGNPQVSAGPTEQTQLWARANRPKQPWQVLRVIPGRVASMAARESQLAVLLDDGSWLTVFPDGAASGQPLPADGRLVALGDDGESLWAVGRVNGGMAAAEAGLARQAAATQASDGQTTRPATAAAAAAAEGKPGDPLVVFHQEASRWVAVAALPPDVPASAADDLSMVVIGRAPAVAYRQRDGGVRTLRLKADGHGWETLAGFAAEPDGRSTAGFQLLADAGTGGPVLWTTDGPGDPGRVRVEAAGGTGTTAAESGPKRLAWAGPPPLSGTPVAALAGGYLRVIGPAAAITGGPTVYEQRYELTGAPVGSPAAVSVPSDLGDSTLGMWVQGLLLASLMFTVGTSFYRQFTPGGRAQAGAGAVRGAMAADAATVAPAALSTRAAAGAIDLVPLLAGVLAAAIVVADHPDDGQPPAVAVLLVLVGAVIYLAHTTALEAVTARSAGKWITGLRVATPDGGRPAVWQLVCRNLLRVLDPLVWIVLSPLRQRTADVLANTVVVREGAAAGPPAGGDA